MDRQGGDGRRRSCCQQKASPDDDDNEPPTHLSAVSLPLPARSFSLCLVAPLSSSLPPFASAYLHQVVILFAACLLWSAGRHLCLGCNFCGRWKHNNLSVCLCLRVRLCWFLRSALRPAHFVGLLVRDREKRKKIYRSQACCDKNKQWAKKKKMRLWVFFMKLLNTR